MELEFDRDVIHGYEVLADGTVCQEEGDEARTPQKRNLEQTGLVAVSDTRPLCP